MKFKFIIFMVLLVVLGGCVKNVDVSNINDNKESKVKIYVQQGHSKEVNSVAFSPDGKYIASASDDNRVELWDIKEKKEIFTFKGHSRDVFSVAFSPDGKYIASGSRDKTVKLWDIREKREIATFKGHSNDVNSVAFSPNGEYIVSGSRDKTVKLWDIREKKEIATFKGHSNSVTSVAFSPNGEYIASGSDDNRVKLWDMREKREIFTFKGDSSSVYSVVFSPNGKYIASGSDDNRVKLWDMREKREIFTFKGHSRSVYSVVFSPDGKYIASGSDDNRVKLWDIEEKREITTFKGRSDWVTSVAFSPNGEFIISGSADGTIKIWNIKTNKYLTLIPFTDGEWVIYDENNFYDSSKNGDKYISFVIDGKNYDFKQYESIYKKPNLLASFLGETEEIISKEEIVKYADITNFLPPEVFIGYFEHNKGMLKPKSQITYINKLNLIGEIRERQQGIKKIEIFLNERVIKTIEVKNEKVYQLNEKIELQKGENEISILAYSIDGIKNRPQSINLNYQDVINKGDSFYVIKKIKEWLKDSQDFAILIGVKDYSKESGFKKLPYAIRDVNEIKNTLIKHFNFDEDNIFTLHNKEATKENIEALLTETITDRIKKSDRLFIFFSGHGYQREMANSEKSAYIVPYGVKHKTNYSNMIDLDQIVDNQYFKYIKAKQILIVLDSCYSGNIVDLTKKNGDLKDDTIELIKDKLNLYGRDIITAGSSGQDTVMGSKWDNHSILTYYFLKAIREGEADYNRNGVVSLGELEVYLQSNIHRETGDTPLIRDLAHDNGGEFIFYKGEI